MKEMAVNSLNESCIPNSPPYRLRAECSSRFFRITFNPLEPQGVSGLTKCANLCVGVALGIFSLAAGYFFCFALGYPFYGRSDSALERWVVSPLFGFMASLCALTTCANVILFIARLVLNSQTPDRKLEASLENDEIF